MTEGDRTGGFFEDFSSTDGYARLLRAPKMGTDVRDGQVVELPIAGRYQLTDVIGVSRMVYVVGFDPKRKFVLYSTESVESGTKALSNTLETMHISDVVDCRRTKVLRSWRGS